MNAWMHGAWLAYLSGCHTFEYLGVRCWWGW